MDIKEYIERIDPAINYLFLGLDQYSEIDLQRADPKSKIFLKEYANYIWLSYSRACLAGSILQLVYTGIKSYSEINKIDNNIQEFGFTNKIYKFSVGRRIYDLPIGFYIYAGRNQFNHYEEGWKLNKNNTIVFKQLLNIYEKDSLRDMVYELEYPIPEPKSFEIVWSELSWKNYSSYYSDINEIIEEIMKEH